MTRDEIRGIVEGISDEQLKKILDINSQDIGKAKAAASVLEEKLKEASANAAKMEEEISALRLSQGEADEMKIKIEELQKVIDLSAEKEAQRKSEEGLMRRFEAAAGNAEFLNEFTRAGVLEEFKAAILAEENAGRADGEIYGELVSGRDNIFAPQGGVPSVVASTMGFGGSITDSDVREIMGLPVFE